jgi:integrase
VQLIDGEVVVEMLRGDERRTIALPPYVVELMAAQKARLAAVALAFGKGWERKPMYLLPGLGGGPRNPKTVTSRMERLIKRCGIAMVDAKGRKLAPCHSWRHTSGTSLYHAYKNLKQVQALFGHATSKGTSEALDSAGAFTMDGYIDAFEGDREAAAHFERLLRK